MAEDSETVKLPREDAGLAVCALVAVLLRDPGKRPALILQPVVRWLTGKVWKDSLFPWGLWQRLGCLGQSLLTAGRGGVLTAHSTVILQGTSEEGLLCIPGQHWGHSHLWRKRQIGSCCAYGSQPTA